MSISALIRFAPDIARHTVLNPPLEKISAEDVNWKYKIIPAIAIMILTVSSLGLYLVYAYHFFSERHFEQLTRDLDQAVNNNQLNRVHELFQQSPKLKKFISGNQGSFPHLLHVAISEGYLDMASLLKDNGADINADGRMGPPLTCAVYFKQLQAIDWCLNNGANVNLPLPMLKTPLYTALEVKAPFNFEIIKKLLQAGANPNCSNDYSVLRRIGIRDNWIRYPEQTREIIAMMIKKGACLNPGEYQDMSPEVLAFIKDHLISISCVD